MPHKMDNERRIQRTYELMAELELMMQLVKKDLRNWQIDMDALEERIDDLDNELEEYRPFRKHPSII